MPACSGYGCTNRPDRDRTRSLTFHLFPKDEDLRRVWIQATKRVNFTPSKSAVLCSEHFTEEAFDRSSQQCVRLKIGAVPSIFVNFPSHLQSKVKQRKPPPQRSIPPNNDRIPQCIPPVSENSPGKETLKRKLQESQDNLESSKKRIKTLLQAKRRLLKKNADLKRVLADLKKQSILSTSSIETLETCAGGVSDLLKRQFSKLQQQPLPVKYSPELRSFALTLHFYSPRAYNYVRKMFYTCLPHPRTVGKWYQSLDDNPGFSSCAFNALRARTDPKDNVSGKKEILCALMMDEVAIRQQVEWDGTKYQGYIDMGTELDNDSLPLAKEALVFMVVCLTSSWKLPVGYFLIDGLGGEERKSLVLNCIERLHDVGVTVVSLTHDGASPNLTMLRSLNVKLDDLENVKSNFIHPVTGNSVHVFLDACHMLKLVRNTLADKGSLFSDQNIIRWEYIKALHVLQQCEGLHLGNKIRSSHIAWFKKKMNVRLAAQTLSDSVACSLEFCLNESFEEFTGCEETIKFIRLFNHLFDILNSRNLRAFGWKSPMKANNYLQNFNFLLEAQAYILSLTQTRNGVAIVRGNRKTGFLGFLLCIQSTISLYKELILSNKYNLNYLLMYKFSQDHIELFFGKIRSMGGCNNNPTVRQFRSAFKKLLNHQDVQDVIRGNSLPLETVPILTVSSSCISKENEVVPSVELINSSSCRNLMVDDDCPGVPSDHDYVFVPTHNLLSLCSKKIVAYIAGFVVFKLKKSIHCEACSQALTEYKFNPLHSLIAVKSKGALTIPSTDVIDICLSCEKYFRIYVSHSSDVSKMNLSNTECHKLIQSVLKHYVNKPIFTSLSKHMLETEGFNNHLVLLIKAISEKYFQVRYYYAGKKYTAHMKETLKSRSRQVLNKVVIFSGQ